MRSQGMAGDISTRALILPAAQPGRTAPLPKGPWKFRRSLPSYISATSFADALIDLLVPNAGEQPTLDAVDRSLKSLQQDLPVAAKSASCQNQSQQDCLSGLQAQLSAAAQAGLPIGWATVAVCAKPKTSCSWLDQRGILSPSGGSGWEAVLVLVGFLITIIALT